MAANTNVSNILEQVSFVGDDGSMQRGSHREIISGQAATRTLRREESGALCLFDRAAGIVYTLPTSPTVGMTFEFRTTVTITSNSSKVITGSATQYLLGGINMFIAASAVTLGATANGTTHISVTSNGTTTGGVIGDQFTVTAVSSTVWALAGLISGSGALATPIATT